MNRLLDLWAAAGPWVYFLVLVFFVALAAMALQVALARKVVVPGLFRGCMTAVLGTSFCGMAVGYLLMLDLVVQAGGDAGAVLMGEKVAATPVLFGLGMVAVLLLLRFAMEGMTSEEVLRAFVPTRWTRWLGTSAGLGLVLGGLLLLLAQLTLSDLAARGTMGDDPVAAVDSLRGLVRAGLVMSVAAVLLGAVGVVVSAVSVSRR